MENKKRKNLKIWLIFVILGSLIYKLFSFLFKKDKREDIKINFCDFWKKEKKEVKELATGKESFLEYCRDTSNIFKDYFIPNECNEFKPRVLRTNSLLAIVVFIIFIKVAVTGYLFFIYPNQARMEEQITNEILNLTNNDRAINNIPGLQLNPVLSLAALNKAEDMLAKGYFAHYSPPDNKKPWDWIPRSSYPYIFVGENLAMNFTSAKSVEDALMQSPSHRKNILNPVYKEVGLAVVTGNFNGEKTNILVETFASRKSGPALAVATSQNVAATTTKEVTQTGKIAVAGSETKATPAKVENKPAPKPKVNTPKPIAVATSTANTKATSTSLLAKAETEPLQYGTQYSEEKNIGEAIAESMSQSEELIASQSGQAVVISSVADAKINYANNLLDLARNIFIIVLVFLVFALIVNIFVKFSVQHKPVIFQTLAVIVLIIGLLSVQFHILEKITEQIVLI